MKNKKIFILFPDGVGLRNFAYTKFNEIGQELGFDIVYWNNTIFDLTSLGYKECKMTAKTHWFSDILKTALINIGLTIFSKRTNDKVYDTYRFPYSYKNIKSIIKSLIINTFVFLFSSEKGYKKIKKWLYKLEQETSFYQQCLQTLQKEKPAFVFSTNQRNSQGIAPLLAAKKLGIPTATFIFSWDNMPKAILLVEADYYFVWSDYMKNETMFYYPDINENQIIVTGTPQFEPHYDESLIIEKQLFFEKYNLGTNKKYICFTGDDHTTSPDDPQYLQDVAQAVEKCNNQGHNLGLIFRRCPTDFSKRYDEVINRYKNIITVIDPLWKPFSTAWNTVLPTKEDLSMLSNIAEHTEMVINVGSSTVFDFVAHQKPCGYFNYNQENQQNKNWSVQTIYSFVHFRSMPNKDTVVWLNNKEELADKILETLQNPEITVNNAKKWFEVINKSNPIDASNRVWKSITKII